MDDKTYASNLGELKVAAALAEQHYDVFVGWGGKSVCDLVAHKDGVLYRVQIKTTSTQATSGNWTVQIKSVRHNKTANVIHNFDASKCDMLAIYVLPEDRVVFVDPKLHDNGCQLTIPGAVAESGLTHLS